LWKLSLITPAGAEPLDLTTEVKQQLRLETAEMEAQAAVLAAYIAAARRNCENDTGRQLIEATWDLIMDCWTEAGIYRCENGIERLRLPKPPVSAITHVKYRDTAGVEQTWAASNYITFLPAGETAARAEIALAYGAFWPTLQARAQAVTIRFVTGYGAAYSDAPKALRAGMLLHVAEMYERRSEATIGTIQSTNALTAEKLWWPFRTW
jgi:uncharacterized phiE125 gp8 family phage protein